jgi:hypothetical protein
MTDRPRKFYLWGSHRLYAQGAWFKLESGSAPDCYEINREAAWRKRMGFVVRVLPEGQEPDRTAPATLNLCRRPDDRPPPTEGQP